MPERIAIVLKGYPRLSETFIAQEIRQLELRGVTLSIYSLRQPYDPASHPIHAEIAAPVSYLPEYLHDDPARVRRALAQCWRRPGFGRALRRLLGDLARDLPRGEGRSRLRRFGQALVLAAETPAGIDRYYAHFMHTPSSVAHYASLLSGRPWSISAHAKDIWTIPNAEKRAKLAGADWLVTCTRANAEHLAALAGQPAKVELLYHGLDFSRFPEPPPRGAQRDGSDPAAPVRLLSVGRCVEKKGYEVLLDALAALPAQLHWQLTHIGGGELADALRARAAALGLAARIDWRGAQAQTEVLAAYRAADLFVLPSIVGGDGDRDGLPNVLMEAQSQALCCLSTDISGIPELIEDGATGRLVAQRDAAALSAALVELITAPAERRRLGEAGRARTLGEFSVHAGIDRLARKFGVTGDSPGC